MVDSKKFRTRHESISRENIPEGNKFIIGLDAGQSGIKVFFEEGMYCIPYYCKRLDPLYMGLAREKMIIYRDNSTEEMYMVGRIAQEIFSKMGVENRDDKLLSGKRYYDKQFLVLCQTAIGLALLKNNDEKDIFIQTSVNLKCMGAEKERMEYALLQKADFSLKIGRSDQWMDINYELDRDHIDVISGEMSVLYSTITQEDGRDVHIKSRLLRENVLIGDFGYQTNDFCGLLFGNPNPIVSMNSFSMKEIFRRVSNKISSEYGEDINIQALQQNLETGVVVCTNEENLKREKKYFADILADANKSVFKEAMDNLKIAVNYFRGYRYFIVAGGTGEAWFDLINKYLSQLSDLYVIRSNTSDNTIPLLYSVARGNYYYRYIKDQQ